MCSGEVSALQIRQTPWDTTPSPDHGQTNRSRRIVKLTFRIHSLLILLAAAALLAVVWASVCTVERIYWNPTRLAAAYAVAHGLDPYAPQASAAQLGWLYGPVYALVYAPVAAIPDLSCAFMAAALINTILYALPAVLLAWIVWRTWRSAAFAALAALTLTTAYSDTFLWIHVDVIAAALGIVALWALILARESRSPYGWVGLAAMAAALAPWAKQLAVAVPAAMAAWLWWSGERRRAIQFSALAAGATLLLTAGFVQWFGADALWFSMVARPAKIPFSLQTGALSAGRLFFTGGLWFVVGILLLWLRARQRPGDDHLYRITLPVTWLAVTSLPLGLIACFKLGGGPNSIHALYYATAWLALLATWLWRNYPTSRIAVATILLLGALNGIRDHLVRGVYWMPTHYQRETLAWAKAHQGHAYFPWNPLVTILTDHQVYPTEDALYYQRLTGLQSPPAALAVAVPSDAIIVYHDPEPRGAAVAELRNARKWVALHNGP